MSYVIHSNYTNYKYTVDVYIPEGESPKEGFPVIYVLDGLSYFEFAKKTVEVQSKNAVKTKVNPAIVVGINHEKDTMRSRRFYDYTAPAIQYAYPMRMKGKEPEAVGGAEDFHLFIENELKPIIHRDFSVNTNNETLFGHSLGGYYALWSLFKYTNSFANYIALSPSIWWNDHELVRYAEAFIMNEGTCNCLYIAVGELEGFMVNDGQQMFKYLSEHGLNVSFYEALEENHASVVPSVISRAFRYLNQNNR
ncbi:alpha/beta hydrolase [Ferdinandcohnia quinoae]|uniref:Alpha/beta hydrolase-fold protein n=1 Tax=Fredinandcohnia quinoae TaxID=2918902 RepID=A0AAW5E3J3_9BACI|nr:alpha/beta hydrolase-fold protein [Fredinandcohnia sp. SECRCQ15]